MIKIIGCGSLLMGDDAVGCIIARELMKMELPLGVKVIEAGTPGLKLLSLMEAGDRVVILDAVVTGGLPGTIHRFSGDNLPEPRCLPFSVHSISIPDAITLGRKLEPELMPESIQLIGVETELPLKGGKSLSAPIADAVPKVVDMIMKLIRE